MENKLKLLELVLGQGHKANRTYYQFHCPFCRHPKQKLGVDLNSGRWKCWVCNTKDSTPQTLFSKISADKRHIETAKTYWKYTTYKPTTQTVNVTISLPTDYIPLWNTERKDSFYVKRALNYVKIRGLTAKDIIKHQIGYNEKGYLIFPNFDESGQITYYSYRAYDPFIPPHKLPDFDKNIIGDDWLINWNEDIILCESKLDAITIRRNVVPMFGKIPSKRLKQKIISSLCENIIICLDGDATKDVYELSEYFMQNGKNVFYCTLPLLDDANSLGFVGVWEYIDSAKRLLTNDIFEQKVKSKLGI